MAVIAIPALSAAGSRGPVLVEWERGLSLQLPGKSEANMYLWFYEWNMFDAITVGQNTHGTFRTKRTFDESGTDAILVAPSVTLTAHAVPDGAELSLEVKNETDRVWPEIAGIIPCWSPGHIPDRPTPAPANPNFADLDHTHTWFLSASGLERLTSRAIHFNANLRVAVDRASDDGRFVFSKKWPTSPVNAVAGLLIRESEDGRWVTGIAWEDFLSVQGHNPWTCLHACARVGALKPGETRTVRGRLYLFAGTKEDCLARFRRDF